MQFQPICIRARALYLKGGEGLLERNRKPCAEEPRASKEMTWE